MLRLYVGILIWKLPRLHRRMRDESFVRVALSNGRMSSNPYLISFSGPEVQPASVGATEAEAMDAYSRVVTTVAESVSPSVVRIQVERKKAAAEAAPASSLRRMASS